MLSHFYTEKLLSIFVIDSDLNEHSVFLFAKPSDPQPYTQQTHVWLGYKWA